MPPRTFDCENPGVYSDQVQCFTGKDVDVDHYDQYQVLLPVGMGAIGLDLVPNPDSRNKYLLNGAIDPLNDKENLGGRMCASPYHKGVRGDPNALVITKDMDQNFPQYEIGDLIEDPEHPERLIKVCTPWSESEGFFFGDSVTSYHSPGVVLNVQNVDHDGSLLGNAVRYPQSPLPAHPE